MLKYVRYQQLQNWSPKVSQILQILKSNEILSLSKVDVSPRVFVGFEWLRCQNLSL